MQPLNDLYREVILDHNRNPRNFGELPPPCEHAEAHNAFCGDKLNLSFRVIDQRLEKLMFTGAGCALSQASTSMLTEQLAGLNLAEASRLMQQFEQAFSKDETAELPSDLAALLNARQFPSRTDCVLMSWRALGEALQQRIQEV